MKISTRSTHPIQVHSIGKTGKTVPPTHDKTIFKCFELKQTEINGIFSKGAVPTVGINCRCVGMTERQTELCATVNITHERKNPSG